MSIKLRNSIEWMHIRKVYSVKRFIGKDGSAKYLLLLFTKNKILSRLLGHADVNITYNIYIHLYGDGFDELYSALVP